MDVRGHIGGERRVRVAAAATVAGILGSVLTGCGGASASSSASASVVTTATASVAATTTTTTTTATTTATTNAAVGGSVAAAGTAGRASAATAAETPAPGVLTATRKRGAKGAAVLATQQRLSALGYWLGTPNSTYGDAMVHAVTMLQKAAGLKRTGTLDAATLAALNAGVRPKVRSTSGHVVEVDLAHQLVLIVDNGSLTRVLDTSTGSGAVYRSSTGGLARAVTPKGTFKVTRQLNGWRKAPLGMLYRPKYFNGGIAFHGYTSVPSTPASHGCVRLTMAEMDAVWRDNLIPLGATVWVY